jgi:ATP-binding cassette subfamily B protein/subfamily B ATP-binding cassette protein MsbA
MRLIFRLLKFVRPYKSLIALSAIFILFITVIDLSLPYLTKVAIDRHIVVTARQLVLEDGDPLTDQILERYDEKLIPGDSDIFYVRSADLRGFDSEIRRELEARDLVVGESFYLVQKESVSDPRDFQLHGEYYVLTHEETKVLPPAEWVSMRKADLNGLLRIGLIFIAALILGFVFNFLQIYTMEYAGQKVMYDLRMKVFSHLQSLSLTFFDKNPVGRLVTRATNDVETLNQMFTEVLLTFFKDIFLIIGILVVLLRTNWKLALVSFTVLPVIGYATYYFSRKVRDAFRLVRLKIAKLNATLQENFSGMRVVQIFRRELENLCRFKGINHEVYLAHMRQIRVYAVFMPLVEIVSSAAIAIIIWYGGGQVVRDTLSLGALVAFLTYIQMFFRPIRDLTQKYNIMQSAMASSERIFMLLDTQEIVPEPESPVSGNGFKGELEFKDVWFAYKEDEWVLQNVSFKVKPGESVAIVGATGAGKTSIINLLERFYDVRKGQVLLDGKDVRSLPKPYLRTHIGLVMQDVFLFAGDIKGNIRLGNEDISDEDIEQMACHVNAHPFIQRLPNGYDESVKERGATLSVGQRQLLAFARALAFDPKVLILDEATSSIDTETERLIQDALIKLLEGRTSIVIAHRLSTIQHVDRIIVLHKGRIVEEGPHSELLKKKGFYYRLYNLQYQQ